MARPSAPVGYRRPIGGCGPAPGNGPRRRSTRAVAADRIASGAAHQRPFRGWAESIQDRRCEGDPSGAAQAGASEASGLGTARGHRGAPKAATLGWEMPFETCISSYTAGIMITTPSIMDLSIYSTALGGNHAPQTRH